MPNILVREFDIPPGNCAMYYPEANVLIPKVADPQSRTPAFKSAVVMVEATHDGASAHVNGEPQIGEEYMAAGSSRERMNRC